MQKFCIWKLDTKYLKLTHLAKMQKFCIWETGNKIPKIDRVKVRYKNSASEKVDKKYLKLTLSSYSLCSQNCRDTVVSSRPPNVGVHDIGDWIAINSIGKEKESTRREKNSVAFSVPTTAVFLSGLVALSLEWLWKVRKEKERKEKRNNIFKI